MNRDDTTAEQRLPEHGALPPVPGVAIVFEGGTPALRVVAVSRQALAIGRGTAADVFVDDGILSRVHCHLSHDASGYTIVDRSKYGCFVDGRRVPGTTTVPTFRALRLGDSVITAIADVRVMQGAIVEDRDGYIVGPRSARAEREITAAAKAGQDLLVLGETGTGKEWAARTFHAAGQRAGAPLVNVNCAALPANLVEAELFGHVRGTFSGADKDRGGLFEAADGGTLFLDEVGEMPLEVQAKILRVLQERAVRRVGDSRERPVDVRVIAATNRDLDDAIDTGTYRADLYYRLAQATVRLPAFRERVEDPAYFVARTLAKRNAPRATASLIEAVLLRDWPGNARELVTALGEAANNALAARGTADGSEARVDGAYLPAGVPFRDRQPVTEASTTDDGGLTEKIVREALEKHRYSIAATAKALGVHRNTIGRYVARFGIVTKPM